MGQKEKKRKGKIAPQFFPFFPFNTSKPRHAERSEASHHCALCIVNCALLSEHKKSASPTRAGKSHNVFSPRKWLFTRELCVFIQDLELSKAFGEKIALFFEKHTIFIFFDWVNIEICLEKR
ncbi:MAG: hypothetical protein J6Y55_03285 [Bacteroidales bacterium]|nr:hypothetical protein [Bacteroidales bacterium]